MDERSDQVAHRQPALTGQTLRTPRAAAIAGIVFAVLFATSIGLMRLAIPETLAGEEATVWLQNGAGTVRLALTMVPFVVITYLFAIALLVAINLSLWVIMVFLAWVFAISVYILVESLRGKTGQAAAAVGAGE